jgi:FMN reductase
MRVLVFSCSLNPTSRGAQLAQLALEDLRAAGHEAELVVLAELGLPVCDGGAAYEHPMVEKMTGKIHAAQGIVMAVPVYNYDINAAAKNLIELTGTAWTGKVVGFLCAAGGPSSYMSVMPFANSLMLDFRCVVVPRFVYATEHDFVDEQLDDEGELRKRVRGLAADVADFAGALAGLTDRVDQ